MAIISGVAVGIIAVVVGEGDIVIAVVDVAIKTDVAVGLSVGTLVLVGVIFFVGVEVLFTKVLAGAVVLVACGRFVGIGVLVDAGRLVGTGVLVDIGRLVGIGVLVGTGVLVGALVFVGCGVLVGCGGFVGTALHTSIRYLGSRYFVTRLKWFEGIKELTSIPQGWLRCGLFRLPISYTLPPKIYKQRLSL
jgi:hypothetical protein